jgi:glycosyltransferase involved in cell wall biosynthesis
MSPRTKVLPKLIPPIQTQKALNFLGISNYEIPNRLYVSPISIATRFSRPQSLAPFHLKTHGYDFFIQQQIDPLTVSKGTIHIVRLHDILPITHPQYFDDLSVYFFKKGLSVLMKNQQIVWVMDTIVSSLEFQAIFPSQKNVFAIPCVVGAQFEQNKDNLKRENSFVLIGTIEPRKQIRLAIDAFKYAKSQSLISSNAILTIAGNYGWQEEHLYSLLKSGFFGDDVRYHEGKSDVDISKLLDESEFIISASAAEGFGLTPLEGMLHGCIPIASDIPQHRETMKNHAVYFEPTLKGLVDCLEKLEESKNSQNRRVSRQRKFVTEVYSENRIGSLWVDLLEISHQNFNRQSTLN